MNPQGPKGRFHLLNAVSHSIYDFSPAKEEARAFLKWMTAEKQLGGWYASADSYYQPLLHGYDNAPMWDVEPRNKPYRDALGSAHLPGWPAPPRRATWPRASPNTSSSTCSPRPARHLDQGRDQDRRGAAEGNLQVRRVGTAGRADMAIRAETFAGIAPAAAAPVRAERVGRSRPRLQLADDGAADPVHRGDGRLPVLSTGSTSACRTARWRSPAPLSAWRTSSRKRTTRCSGRSCANTFIYTAVATVLKMVGGLGLALAMNQHFRFKNIIRALLLLPFIVPTVLSTVAWMWMLDPAFSVFNRLLIALGCRSRGRPGSATRIWRCSRSS